MKLSIEGTSAEIKNALQAICGSEERKKYLMLKEQQRCRASIY